MSDLTCVGCDLSPASFRGVSFWVENDTEDYGRRVVTHEYPMRDKHENEDLGERAQKFKITAYVVGDDAVSQKDAIVSACRTQGAGLLRMPANGAFLARCLTLSVTRSLTEQCYFKLHMEFVAEPGVFALSALAGMVAAVISSILRGAYSSVSASFSSSFTTTGVLPYVVNNAVARVLNFAAIAMDRVERVNGAIQDDTTASVMTDITGLVQNVDALVRPGPNDPSSETMVTTIGDIFYGMLAAYSPDDLIESLKALARYTYLEQTNADGVASYFDPSEAGLSASKIADANNAAAFNGTVRIFALIALASAMAEATYPNRSAAVQARADLVELFDQQIERTTDEAVSDILVTARDHAVRALSKNAANLVSVVTVTSPTSMPVLYWANRLYADTTRSLELVDRNGVTVPAFMPQVFQALQS